MNANLDKQFPFLSKIPLGSHGHGKYQKRLWKVTSDYVRIRDIKKGCVTCGKRFSDWHSAQWQACHYKAFSSCRGYSKFDVKNIFGGCGYCNTGWNAYELPFKENIIKLYGQERIDYIDMFSKYPSEKMDDFKCCLLIKEVLKEMADLPEQPEYYEEYRKL